MIRSTWMKFLILLLAISMTVSLFACEEPEADTDGETESKTEDVTEDNNGSDGTATSSDDTENNNDETEPDDNGSEESSDDNGSEESSDDNGGDETDSEEAETSCYHPYAADERGHWKPACSVCGKKEGKVQSHEYEEKVEDEGDLLLYTFKCTRCKYIAYEQEVPYEINSFYSAGELAYADASGLSGTFGFDSGVGYASYSSENGGRLTLTVLAGGDAGAPSGKYLVMKVRMPASQGSFSALIRSVSSSSTKQSVTFSGLKSGWATIIVDITKAVSEKTIDGVIEKLGYQPDASGEYYLGDFQIVANAGANESFDIAYVMFCDTIEDAQNFTKDEKNIYTYTDILSSGPESSEKPCVDENGNPIVHKYVINDDGTHTLEETCYQCGLAAVKNEPHVYAQMIVDGEMTYACSKCNAQRFGEGAYVNKYISAEEINSIGFSYYKMDKQGITEDAETGFTYASYTGQSTTAQIIFVRTGFTQQERDAAFNVGKANYFVIRMRTNTPAVSFAIRFGTTASGNTGVTLRLPTSLTPAGEWATYVVDLATVIPKYYVANSDGTYTISEFYYHIGAADFTSDVVYDVQYMAFVDSWENEIEALVTDETVVNVISSNGGNLVTTVGKGCLNDAHSFADPEKTAGANGEDVYTYSCSVCGKLLTTKTISSSVKRYYTPVSYSAEANTRYNLSAVPGYDDGVPYVHIRGNNGKASQILFQRSKLDQADASAAQQYTENVGKAKWLVIKARANRVDLDARLVVSTDQYNGTGGTQNGKCNICLPLTAVQAGEWATYVVNLEDVLGADKYKAGENGEYTIDTFYAHFEKFEATDYLDIAYTAFVEGSWTELDSLIDEATVVKLTSADKRTFENVNTADGSKAN